MKNPKSNFRIMLLVGVPALAWLLAELFRVSLEVSNRSGVGSLALDGVVQHKVGELMVGAPLFLILLLSNVWSRDKAFALISRTRLVMVAGGLLNGLAWYTLRGREAWDGFFRVWCLILLSVGLSGAHLARWVVTKTKAGPSA